MTDIIVTDCPTCERPFAEGEDIPVEVLEILEQEELENKDFTDETFSEEEEPTELDVLEDYIDLLKERAKNGPRNIWLLNTIARLEAYAKTGFDYEGKKFDLTPPIENVIIQFSPPEALTLEGWWTVHPQEYGKLSRYLGKRLDHAKRVLNIDPFEDGLDLSRARSNGCYVVRNVQETADEFLNNTAQVAKDTGTTERIIKMMGYALDGRKTMFPTFDFYGASKKRVTEEEGVGHYAFDPEIPFNEDEQRVYRHMYSRYNFSGGALVGAKWSMYPVSLHPEEKDASKREFVAENSRHNLMLVTNHPWWVMPLAMLNWNTNAFKNQLWRTMCFRASAIDRKEREPVPGYMPREEIDSNPHQWIERNGENTSAASKTKPRFNHGSELNRDGTRKAPR